MLNKNIMTRTISAAILAVSTGASARDGAADAADHMSYGGSDNAGFESIPSEIIRAMMRAETLSDE